MNKDVKTVIDDILGDYTTARQQNAFIKAMSPGAPGELVSTKAHHSDFEMPVDLVVRVAAVAAVVVFLCGAYVVLMGVDPMTVEGMLFP